MRVCMRELPVLCTALAPVRHLFYFLALIFREVTVPSFLRKIWTHSLKPRITQEGEACGWAWKEGGAARGRGKQ